MVKKSHEGTDDTIESDLTDPLVEGGIAEHGVELLLSDHTVLTHYVVHVDKQVQALRPASEQGPKVDVTSEMTP